MSKDIQQIIKAAAERYGLDYDLNNEYAKVLQSNGDSQVLSQETLVSVFNVDAVNTEWIKVTNEKVEWSKLEFKIILGESLTNCLEIHSAA